MKRCLQCNAPSLGDYCTPGCVAAAVTKKALDDGDTFPEGEREAVKELIKQMEQT